MSELIDRQAALDVLCDACGNCACPKGKIPRCSYYEKMQAIPTASPWHRVEEPPKEEGKYLVYDGRGNYFVAWWGPRLGWCYDPKFFCYWMPIEPPKEIMNE